MRTSFDQESPQFDAGELEQMLARTLERSAVLSARRVRRWMLAGSASLGVLLAAVVGVVALASGGAGTGTPARLGPAPQWKLVADVSAGWQVLPGPNGGNGLPAIELSCPSLSTCFALGFVPGKSSTLISKLEVTTDSGRSWKPVNLPVPLSLGRLSCVSASDCALLGRDTRGATVFFETSDDGHTWTRRGSSAALPAVSLVSGLSCLSVTTCTAVVLASGSGTVIGRSLRTSDGGRAWAQSTLPNGLRPRGLTCTTGGDCVATGAKAGVGQGAADVSDNGGLTWTTANVPRGIESLQRVACNGSGFCITTAVGSGSGSPSTAGSILTSNNSGHAWAQVSASDLPRTARTPHDVACPTRTICWVSGGVAPSNNSGSGSIPDLRGLIAKSSDRGQTWQTAQLPSSVRTVVSLSCPTDTSCYAIAILTPGGGRGSKPIGLLSDGGRG